MACKPSDNVLNPVVTPGIPIPGFGIPTSPIQINLDSFDLPESLLQDLMAYLNKLNLPFPGLGNIAPNFDTKVKDIFDGITRALNLISPFLGFYKFIMSALQMITCIIEVLCAIPNPFAVASKLVKLFKECLPNFLNLFPMFALIAIILAVLLLIIYIVEYLITTIFGIIDAIVKNLDVLGKAITLEDSESRLAAAQKIAMLLCSIENLMSILVSVASIIAVIKALSLIGGGAICSDEDPDGCCSEDICPSFIKDSLNGLQVNKGKLIYYSQIGVDTTSLFPGLDPSLVGLVSLPPVRSERWQLFDADIDNVVDKYSISKIITPVMGNIFWPDDLSFNKDSQVKKVPYTATLTVELDPKDFGNSTDTNGSRKFTIKDCIVVRKPYIGVMDQSNNIGLYNKTGTLNVEGGLVFEEDGTPFMKGDGQATLNTFIFKDSSTGGYPIIDDAIEMDIEFNWVPNAPSLAGYNLTTVGCVPEVAQEKTAQNAIAGAEGWEPVLVKIGELPDTLAAAKSIQDAIAEFRKDVSIDGAAIFRKAVDDSLGKLKEDSLTTYCISLRNGISQFKSVMSLNTDVQFTSRSIDINVVLYDAAGNILSRNIHESCVPIIESLLKTELTFGSASSFVYDGVDTFTSQISSPESGSGEVRVLFDNKLFSVIDSTGVNTVIDENVLEFEFIGIDSNSPVRRDESDTEGA